MKVFPWTALRKERLNRKRQREIEAELLELRKAEAFLSWALSSVYRWPTWRKR